MYIMIKYMHQSSLSGSNNYSRSPSRKIGELIFAENVSGDKIQVINKKNTEKIH